nr:MAG TPA: hypothetical protein [Caudoviricetes sp.]
MNNVQLSGARLNTCTDVNRHCDGTTCSREFRCTCSYGTLRKCECGRYRTRRSLNRNGWHRDVLLHIIHINFHCVNLIRCRCVGREGNLSCTLACASDGIVSNRDRNPLLTLFKLRNTQLENWVSHSEVLLSIGSTF